MYENYVSKRKTLYKRVFLVTLVFSVSLLVFAMFFMTPRVVVSFNTNSAEYAIPSMQINANEVFGETNYNTVADYQMERYGYIFDDWYASEGIPLSSATIFTKDTTVEAVWIAKHYNLMFDLDGGSYTGAPSYADSYDNTIDFDQTITLPTAENFEKPVVGADNLVLSKWQIVATESFYVNPGTTVKLDEMEDLYREYEPDLDVVEDIAAFMYGDFYIKAVWKQQEVTVTFIGQNGTTQTDVAVVKGTTIPVGNIPTFASSTYDLEGWYYDEAFTSPVNFTTDTFSADVTLYSKWQPKSFNLTFNLLDKENDGASTIYLQQAVPFGEYAYSPENPIRINFDFVEWRVLNDGYSITDLSLGTYSLDLTGDGDYDDEGEFEDYVNYVFDDTNSHVFDFDNTIISGNTVIYATWDDQYEFDNTMSKLYLRYTPNHVNHTVKITGFDSYVYGYTSLVLPEYVIDNGIQYYITGIASGAFANMSALKTIVLSQYITDIDDGAFGDSAGILPNLKEFIVWNTNPNYADLNGVLYSKDYTDLIKYPAAKADTEFVVGKEGRVVDTVGAYAFAGTVNLTTLTVNVETVLAGAFSGAESLTSLMFTDKVQTIGENVFSGTINLTNLTVDTNNTYFDADTYAIYTEGFAKLIYYKLANVNNSWTVPNATTIIAKSAFAYNLALRTVYLNNTQVIETYAFAFTGIETISMLDSLLTIQPYAFHGSVSITSITLPGSLTEIAGLTQTAGSVLDNIFVTLTGLTEINVTTGSLADHYIDELILQGWVTTVQINRT